MYVFQDPTVPVDLLAHEAAHAYDEEHAKEGRDWSVQSAWNNAIVNDSRQGAGNVPGHTYDTYSQTEDLAYSVQDYYKDPGGFSKRFKNRAKVINDTFKVKIKKNSLL